MTTADDAAQAEAEERWPTPYLDTFERKAFVAGAAWQRERRPDVTQREAVARAIWVAQQNTSETRDAAGRYWDRSDFVDAVIPRDECRGLADAALAAIAPVQSDPLRAGVEALAARVIEVHHHDMEAHATSFNEGYEAAVTQGLADDPTLAAEWLAAHDAEVAAKALRDAADEVGRLDFGPAPLFSRAAAHKHGSDVAADRLRSRADTIENGATDD